MASHTSVNGLRTSPRWFELFKSGKYSDFFIVALHVVPAEIIMRKTRGVLRGERSNCICHEIGGIESPKVLLQKNIPYVLGLEGEVLLIIFLLKEKERGPRNSIQKPQLGVVRVFFAGMWRSLPLLYGLREFDRMHHESDLGEQACMFLMLKSSHVTQGNYWASGRP